LHAKRLLVQYACVDALQCAPAYAARRLVSMPLQPAVPGLSEWGGFCASNEQPSRACVNWHGIPQHLVRSG
jgi:hypothetical protein